MKRIALIAFVALMVPASAQQPPRPSSCAMFSGELAKSLAAALTENDTLSARVATLTAELEASRKTHPDKEQPK